MKKAIFISIFFLLLVASGFTSYLILFTGRETVSFASDVPGYVIGPANEKRLQNLLEEWGTFGNENTVMPGIKNIAVVLVTDEQPYSPLKVDNKIVLQSHGQSSKDGDLTVYVYMNPDEVLKREKIPSIATRITLQALWAIYSVSVPLNASGRVTSIEDFLEYLGDRGLLLNPIIYVEKTK